MPGVLEGVRVLDMGRYIAGPLCGALLGDMGAEVIRIERVGGGEDRGQYPTGDEADPAGANFLAYNRNKLGMTLDPSSERGREVLRRLIATADILVVNLPLSTVQGLGLDYESLTAIKRDIILVHTSAFGVDGPYAERVGFDGVGQAMSGGVYLSGDPGRPMKSIACWVDVTTALFNALGALAALMHRRATGEGQKVETNLLRSAMTLTNGLLIEQAVAQTHREPTGNRLQSGGPGDIVRTKDGWILLQVVGDPLYRRWAKLMGEAHWLSDPSYANDGLRSINGEALSARTAAWAAERTTDEALQELAAARIPAGPVLSPQQVLEDAHVAATGLLRSIAYPGLERPIPYVESGARLSATPAQLRRPPTIGEHTDQILAQLGYSTEEVAAFRHEGAV